MTPSSFRPWGIQTGPFAACLADFFPNNFHLFTQTPIINHFLLLQRQDGRSRALYFFYFIKIYSPHAIFPPKTPIWQILAGECSVCCIVSSQKRDSCELPPSLPSLSILPFSVRHPGIVRRLLSPPFSFRRRPFSRTKGR